MVNGIFAQSDSVKLDLNYLKHYWTDTRDLAVSPANWDKKDWTRFGIFTGTAAALFFVDEPVRDFLKNNRTDCLDHVTHDFFSPLGGTWSVFISTGYYGVGLVCKNGRMKSTGLMAVESYLVGSLLANISKYAFGGIRPDSWWGPSPFEWKGPFGGNSFPSGHTTAAFSVAAVFATKYRETKWAPVVAYSLATAVGISRIYENRHWASDVFAGAVLGLVTGKLICRNHMNGKLVFIPVLNREMKGTTLLYRL